MSVTTANELLEKLGARLSELHQDYPARLKGGAARKELDWELCAQGAIPEAELIAAYSEASGLPIAEDSAFEDVQRQDWATSEFLSGKCALPLSKNGAAALLAISDPYCMGALSYALKRMHGLDAEFVLARRSSLERLIASIYDNSKGDLKQQAQGPQDASSEEALRTLASEAKIVRLVNEMMNRAVEQNASDIHVEPEEDRLIVRYRIDGILQERFSLPLSQYPAVASRIKLIGGMNIAESRLPQDGRSEIQMGRAQIDLRISTVPTMNGESIVLRVLRKDSMEFNLRNLGMSEAMETDFKRLVALPHGMILVVGPTGSGKTTTLYSVMTHINTPDVKIITIEDPVEYRMARLTQMQVNAKIGLTFANGLRHIVRQDPDIILVGEIRDRETAEIAIHAALTGHLVFSTLHTNDAAGAVSRLLDMGIEGFLISSSLCGVLSQRLVRKVCPGCSGSGTDAERPEAKCRLCLGSGFKGRGGIFELLMVNEQIRTAVNRSADSSQISAIARSNGMIPLLDDGRAKVISGFTTEAELARAVSETL